MKTKKHFLKTMLAIIVMSLSINTYGEVYHDTVNVGETVNIHSPGIWEIWVRGNEPIYLKITVPLASNILWHDYCPGNCTNDSIIAEFEGDYMCDLDVDGQPAGIQCHVYYLPSYHDTLVINICDGDSIFCQQSWQKTSGIYYDSLTTVLGCDSIIVTQLTVNPTFTINGSISICNGDSILLGGAYQYVAGSYYDSLSTVNGCDSIIVTQLTVQQPLTAGFNYLANNLDVTFTNTSSNSTNSYWDFGDGTTSNDINPLHTYSQNGYFHILLTVFDSTSTICNTQATASADIEVGTGTSCVSGFSYNITTKSTNVLFTDTSHSNGNIHQWYWDFGDGTTSNLQNPQHHFTHNGYFNVSLTIQDTINDCVDDCQQTIEIGISDTTSDCEASFSYYVNNNNRKAWFTNTSLTIDPIINAIWSFGDGDISTLLNPLHQYQTEGYYEVCLTIYTGTCTNISCQTILVGNPSACWADMIYTVDLPTNTVYFSNISYGMIPTSFNWNFGDGGQSNVENPVHTYPDSGTYHVHYHIKNLPDCNSHINVIVNLNPTILLASGFIVIPDSSSNKSTEYPVDFYGASFGDPSTLLWEFGDGTTDSTAWRITHAYQDSGTYQVCLTVSDLYLGAYTYCDSVYVGDIISDSHIHTVPKPEIRIYPNPTQDWLQIDGVENNIMIKLTDIVGKEIMVIKNTNKIDISHISPGTYLLVIQTDTQRTVLILIKE